MNRLIGVVTATMWAALAVTAQQIELQSTAGNGQLTAWGLRPNTTATVEWAASLTEAGRTNWHMLSASLATNEVMTADIPMFFRVMGTPDTNLPPGLVAYYPFNGNANDESGHGYTSIVHGVLTPATNRFGAAGGAFNFDGASYIDTGVALELQNGAVSVSLWTFLPAEGGADDAVFGHSGLTTSTLDNYRIWRNSPDSFSFHAVGGVGSYATSASVPHGQWVHLVAVAQHAPTIIHRLYVNGVFYDGGYEGVQSTLVNMYIGAYNGGGVPTGLFHGIIDDVRIYNRALSPVDVWKLQNMTY